MDEKIEKCPLCDYTPITYKHDFSRDVYHVSCARCGKYTITWECIRYTDVNAKLQSFGYLLSALARELFETKKEPPLFMTNKLLDEYSKNFLIPNTGDIEEKARKIIEHLKEGSEHFGQFITLKFKEDYSLAYAKNEDEFIALIKMLEDEGLLEIRGTTNMDFQVSLTVRAWDITKKLEKERIISNQGFVAIWFDDSMLESIDSIEAAITETGFTPICIKDKHFSETIMDKALSEIRRSKFLVVDLTSERNSVFFEAGFAYGLGIDIIYVYRAGSEKDSPLEFYVKHYQCYAYKDKDELKSILINAIKARIT